MALERRCGNAAAVMHCDLAGSRLVRSQGPTVVCSTSVIEPKPAAFPLTATR